MANSSAGAKPRLRRWNGMRIFITGGSPRPTLKYSGWQTCSFCTPEALFGTEDSGPVFGGFSPFSAENPMEVGCTPEESYGALLEHLRELLPEAREKDIRKILE